MARVFFPGCKVKAKYPQASSKLLTTAIQRGYVDEVTGCCRVNHQTLDEWDTAVCICVNCMAMIDEDGANEETVNIWQLIDQDESFPFPDHSGMTVSIEDCGRSYDRTALQDAVRSILRKMNIEIVEMPSAREKSTYCGASAYMPIPKQDGGFAPQRYTVDAPARGMFVETPADEVQGLLDAHAATIPCDNVVCYCTACDAGLESSGKNAINLLELVFPD